MLGSKWRPQFTCPQLPLPCPSQFACARQEVLYLEDHRTIEWPWLKRTTMLIQFQPPAMCRVSNHQTRLPRATSSLALNASRDGAPQPPWATCSSTPATGSREEEMLTFRLNTASWAGSKLHQHKQALKIELWLQAAQNVCPNCTSYYMFRRPDDTGISVLISHLSICCFPHSTDDKSSQWCFRKEKHQL